MISRRTLRTKVFQSLFAYYQDGPASLVAGEKQLAESLDRMYDLFLYELMAILEVRNQAEEIIDVRRAKKLPTPEDLKPNTRFIEHPILQALLHHEGLTREVSARKIHWKDHASVIRKVFQGFSGLEAYDHYLAKPQLTDKDHANLLLTLYDYMVRHASGLEHIYEEKYLHWADDIDAVRMMVVQFLKDFKAEQSIPALFADREDRALALVLYRKTALGTETFDKLLESKVQNWDMDRIALTDMVLMRMALAEFLYLEEVPPKVTINEYIELSKEYSTPRSGVFINGLLDQCLIQLKEEGQIKKVGRGLL
jgi:N utilization substance protein B